MFAANEIIPELEAYEGEHMHDYDNVAIVSDVIHLRSKTSGKVAPHTWRVD